MSTDASQSSAKAWKRTKLRLTTVTLICFAFAGLIVGRAALVQVKGDERLADLARKQFQSKVLVRPRRGLILDRNGEPFAVNLETRSLAANPQKLKGKRHILSLVSKALGIPVHRLKEKLTDNREFVWIRRHIPDENFAQFKRMGLMNPVTGELVEGFWLVKESQRVYPHGELASQMLGSVNVDAEGLEGVEVWQNERLRGKIVSVNAIRDALGRPTFIDTDAAKNLKDGEPVTLTLDASLQFSVEQDLKESVQKTRAKSGSVIVMNADSGEILAMASLPGFNPNQRGGPLANRRNRPVTDGYEPGSVIKPILMASALSNGWKSSELIWGGKGQLVVQGRKISEAETHEKFDWLSLKKIITVSSNVGAAKVAMKLGADKFAATLKSLGMGTRTQSGFPGELAGWLPPTKGMQPLTLATIGFGQGMFVTPLQVVRAYASILNGGMLVQPKLIKDPPVKELHPSHRVFTKAVTEKVIDALLSVVESEEGTGKKAALDGYRVAGKTGTSQVVDARTKRYSNNRYIASFVGFAVGVEPKLVILTQLDHPQGVYYAAETAVPLFQKVLLAAANRFGLPSNPKLILAKAKDKQTPTTSPTLAQDQIKIMQSSAQSNEPTPAPIDLKSVLWEGQEEGGKLGWKMPVLRGLSAREVIQALDGRDFKLSLRGFGVVRDQLPAPGAFIRPGDRIDVRLSE